MPQIQFSKVIPVIPASAPVSPTASADISLPSALTPCKAQAASNATLYGVNRRKNPSNVDDFGILAGDESTRSFTGLDCITGANVVDASELTAAASLRFVVEVNKVPLKRVGGDEAPIAGEFSISTGSKSEALLTFTGTPEDGSTLLIEDASGYVTYFEFAESGDYAEYGYDSDIVETTGDVAENLADAINDSALDVSAIANPDGTVSVVLGEAGGAGSVTDFGTTNITVTDFTTAAATGVYLTLGTAPLVGDSVKLHRYDADEVYSVSLVANQSTGSRVYDFMGTATVVANLVQ
jgi:hypothetical protein